MKFSLTLLFFFFTGLPTFAQSYFYDRIDSTVMSVPLSENDWVISLLFEQAGRIPMYDSLGNVLDDDPEGLYIISKINKHCSLKKYVMFFPEITDGYKLQLDKQINIVDTCISIYTKDSILKATSEWIFPNIYLDEKLGTYDIQQNGSHSPEFRLCFRTRDTVFYSRFGEIDVFTNPRFKDWFHKNLNFQYNSSTFIYRAFTNIIGFLKKNFKFFGVLE